MPARHPTRPRTPPRPATRPGAPAFTAATLDGEEFDSAARFAEELAGAVAFVGVAGRGETAEMAEFVADTGTGGFDHVVDTDGAIWSDPGVVAQPAFAFVGRDGLVDVVNGALPPDGLRAAPARSARSSGAWLTSRTCWRCSPARSPR